MPPLSPSASPTDWMSVHFISLPLSPFPSPLRWCGVKQVLFFYPTTAEKEVNDTQKQHLKRWACYERVLLQDEWDKWMQVYEVSSCIKQLYESTQSVVTSNTNDRCIMNLFNTNEVSNVTKAQVSLYTVWHMHTYEAHSLWSLWCSDSSSFIETNIFISPSLSPASTHGTLTLIRPFFLPLNKWPSKIINFITIQLFSLSPSRLVSLCIPSTIHSLFAA